MIEDRHVDRVSTGDDCTKEKSEEYQFLLGLQGVAHACPPNSKSELQKTAAVMKERRKAREERVLARQPAPKKGAGGDK